MKLLSYLLDAAQTSFDWSDALVTPGLPLLLVSPSGNRPFGEGVLSADDVKELVEYSMNIAYGSDWHKLMQPGNLTAWKPAIDFENAGSETVVAVRYRLTIARSMVAGGWSVVVRKVPTTIPSMRDMGLSLNDFTSLLQGSGLILVTGPTKQGKSTVVASMVEQLRTSRAVSHIVKIEDPIEFRHPADQDCLVTQREIGTHVGSYLEAAEDALRMAPGAITIGEIRDSEDAMAALNVGESGHLVLATMQSTTVEGALLKLRALTSNHHGSSDAIANSIKAVIRTALVPSVDGDHYHLAYEWLVKQGTEVSELLRDWNSRKLRDMMRQNSLGNAASPLNRSLMKLVKDGKITEQSAATASNDLGYLQTGSQLKFAAG